MFAGPFDEFPLVAGPIASNRRLLRLRRQDAEQQVAVAVCARHGRLSGRVSFDGTPSAFRQACLDELKRLRKSGQLSASAGSAAEIARQTAGFRRHADSQGLIEEARRAVDGVGQPLGRPPESA